MGFNPFKAITRVIAPVTKAVGRVVGVSNLAGKLESAVVQPGKAISSVARAVASDPVRATLAFTTYGGSELVRKVPVVGDIYSAATNIAAAYVTGGATIGLQQLGQTLTGGRGNFYQPGEPTMALNIGGLLQSASSILGGGQNPFFQGASQVAGFASNFFQPSASLPSYGPPSPMVQTMAAAPMIRSVGTALTRDIFDAGGKVLARLGISYGASASGFSSTLKRALSSIASLARRTPSGTMVSILAGLGLTLLEANMLTAWHAQRKKGRRMNPANARALRRAARRIKGFHRLCTHTDLIKSRGRRSVGRCGSCKKSPCRC